MFLDDDHEDINDKAIIAVLQSNGRIVTFIEVDDEFINSDFCCLSYYATRMLIGVSSSYLNATLSASISESITAALEKVDDIDQHTMDALTSELLKVELYRILNIVTIRDDPNVSSVDYALDMILNWHN